MMIKVIYMGGKVGYINRDHILYVDSVDDEYHVVSIGDESYLPLKKRENGEMTCFLEDRTYKTNF